MRVISAKPINARSVGELAVEIGASRELIIEAMKAMALELEVISYGREFYVSPAAVPAIEAWLSAHRAAPVERAS